MRGELFDSEGAPVNLKSAAFQEIFVRSFAADGTYAGPVQRVNARSGGAQFEPSMVALSNGELALAWASVGQDGPLPTDGGVFARVYRESGDAPVAAAVVNGEGAIEIESTDVSASQSLDLQLLVKSLDGDGAVDKVSWVAESARGQGIPDGHLIDRVVVEGKELVFIGKSGGALPSVDEAAPQFLISNAAIEGAGVQEETAITFSGDNDDYYSGGKLRVLMAGVVVEADMVAGDAAGSVAALAAAVNASTDPVITALMEQAKYTDGATSMTIVSAIEQAAPFTAVPEIDYAGVKQTSTFELEDASTYSKLLSGQITDRGAPVFFEGGKVHVTVQAKDENGSLTGQPVTVSVDMPVPEKPVLKLRPANSGVDVQTLSAAGGVLSFGNEDDSSQTTVLQLAAGTQVTSFLDDQLVPYEVVDNEIQISLDLLAGFKAAVVTLGLGMDWEVYAGGEWKPATDYAETSLSIDLTDTITTAKLPEEVAKAIDTQVNGRDAVAAEGSSAPGIVADATFYGVGMPSVGDTVAKFKFVVDGEVQVNTDIVKADGSFVKFGTGLGAAQVGNRWGDLVSQIDKYNSIQSVAIDETTGALKVLVDPSVGSSFEFSLTDIAGGVDDIVFSGR